MIIFWEHVSAIEFLRKQQELGFSKVPCLLLHEEVLIGRHLFPSAKLTFSSQWLSQDISLFLHELSLSPEISVHKSVSLFNF